MKMNFIVFAMSALAFVACSQKEQAAAAEDTEMVETLTEVVEDAPAAVAVVVLDDDSLIRPDMKPEKLTILDFNATWCPPCREFAPVFDEAAKAYPDVEFISIDVDNNKETAAAFGIQSIPTVVFMNGDGVVARYVGTGELLPAESFHKLIESKK